MGVRLYSPTLGRFLQTDPVAGGSANAYDYVYQDPINSYDLDGRMCWSWHCVKNGVKKHMGTIVAFASVASFIPVVGVGFAAIAIGGSAYMAQDDARHGRYFDAGLDVAGVFAGLGDGIAAFRAFRAGRALGRANREYRGVTGAVRNASSHYRSALNGAERAARHARRADQALAGVGVGNWAAHHYGSD